MLDSTNRAADRNKLGGYSLGKALVSTLGAEVVNKRGSTDGCLGGNFDEKSEDY